MFRSITQPPPHTQLTTAAEAVPVYTTLILIGLQVIATNTKYHYCIIIIKAVQSRELKSVNNLLSQKAIFYYISRYACIYIGAFGSLHPGIFSRCSHHLILTGRYSTTASCLNCKTQISGILGNKRVIHNFFYTFVTCDC